MGYADRTTITTKVTLATTATQVFTSPWRNRRRYIVKKLIISNSGAANNIKFYDDDLADATAPVRGDSANAPLLEIQVAAATTVVFTTDQLPVEYYQGGMVAYAAVANPVITVEIEED